MDNGVHGDAAARVRGAGAQSVGLPHVLLADQLQGRQRGAARLRSQRYNNAGKQNSAQER